MQRVRERMVRGILLPVECETVEIVQLRVGASPFRDDPRELCADGGERELSGGALGRIARRDEAHLAMRERSGVEGPGTGCVLVDGAEDGRDDEDRRGRVAAADR